MRQLPNSSKKVTLKNNLCRCQSWFLVSVPNSQWEFSPSHLFSDAPSSYWLHFPPLVCSYFRKFSILTFRQTRLVRRFTRNHSFFLFLFLALFRVISVEHYWRNIFALPTKIGINRSFLINYQKCFKLSTLDDLRLILSLNMSFVLSRD